MVNAEVLFSKICNVFSEDEVPLENITNKQSTIKFYKWRDLRHFASCN